VDAAHRPARDYTSGPVRSKAASPSMSFCVVPHLPMSSGPVAAALFSVACPRHRICGLTRPGRRTAARRTNGCGVCPSVPKSLRTAFISGFGRPLHGRSMLRSRVALVAARGGGFPFNARKMGTSADPPQGQAPAPCIASGSTSDQISTPIPPPVSSRTVPTVRPRSSMPARSRGRTTSGPECGWRARWCTSCTSGRSPGREPGGRRHANCPPSQRSASRCSR
jgi:hypothetical protein